MYLKQFILFVVALVFVMVSTSPSLFSNAASSSNEKSPLSSPSLSIKHQSFMSNQIKQNSQDVECQDGSYCPAGNTCCPTAYTGYSCCPSNNAVCCKDLQHCCPQNFSCSNSGRICMPNNKWVH